MEIRFNLPITRFVFGVDADVVVPLAHDGSASHDGGDTDDGGRCASVSDLVLLRLGRTKDGCRSGRKGRPASGLPSAAPSIAPSPASSSRASRSERKGLSGTGASRPRPFSSLAPGPDLDGRTDPPAQRPGPLARSLLGPSHRYVVVVVGGGKLSVDGDRRSLANVAAARESSGRVGDEGRDGSPDPCRRPRRGPFFSSCSRSRRNEGAGAGAGADTGAGAGAGADTGADAGAGSGGRAADAADAPGVAGAADVAGVGRVAGVAGVVGVAGVAGVTEVADTAVVAAVSAVAAIAAVAAG